jgi:hypothetical protein
MHSDTTRCQVRRIFAGAAADIQNAIAGAKELIGNAPHCITLRATHRRPGPQLVIAGRQFLEQRRGTHASTSL